MKNLLAALTLVGSSTLVRVRGLLVPMSFECKVYVSSWTGYTAIVLTS
jgi:hypothetical protein